MRDALVEFGVGPDPAVLQRVVLPPLPPLTEIVPAADEPVGEVDGSLSVAGWRVAEQRPRDAWAGPTAWEGDEAFVWRRAVPAGNSTPIVVDRQVIVTGVDANRVLLLAALDLATGAETWRAEICRAGLPDRHEKASDAAATPCAIGDTIFVTWAADRTTRIAAFTEQGRRLWQTDLGPFDAGWGHAASAIACGGRLIVSADNASQGFLAAVEPATGRIIWRRARPAASEGSYSSPVVLEGDPRAIAIAGLDGVRAHAYDDGRLLWEVKGLGTVSGASPAVADGMLVASSGYGLRAMLGLLLSGDARAPTVIWREEKPSLVPYVPSPVARDGRLWVVNDDGLAHCRELSSGKLLWKTRLGGTLSASPVLLGDVLLCADEAGKCTALDAATGEKQGESRLPAGCFATPIAVGERLLVRTTAEVICVGHGGK
jgi:outer membrane protein assembly factor BamB